MIRKRPAEFTATAASIATRRRRGGRPRSPRRESASPTIPAASPAARRRRPRPPARRQTASGRISCVAMPAATTPSSGPAERARRGRRRASRPCTSSAGRAGRRSAPPAAATTSSATAIGSEVSSAAPERRPRAPCRRSGDEREPDRDAGAAGRVGDTRRRAQPCARAPGPACRSGMSSRPLIETAPDPVRVSPERGCCARPVAGPLARRATSAAAVHRDRQLRA